MAKQTNTKNELLELKRKYPYIPAYSSVMGSFEYWTEQQLYRAKAINAPLDTYRVDRENNSDFNSPDKAYVLTDIQNPNLLKELELYKFRR